MNDFDSCQNSDATRLDRRRFLAYFSATGLGATLLPGVLWSGYAAAQEREITVDTIREAEAVAGLEFTDEEREVIARGVNAQLANYETIRQLPIGNDVPPALQFNPALPGMTFETERRPFAATAVETPDVPADLEEVAFWPVTRLAAAIEARKISSEALTEMYLARLKRYDPILKCVISLTEERARRQAKEADAEIAAGRYRGALHGIPWGAKDLLAVKGYKTTWGATPYKDQVIDEDATVVRRLDEAGAVLIAKLTLGALALGDVWFGGRTRNPWNPERGSSGSSAGPGSATAAGLVGFSIGTETVGSIASPSTVNGVTGLRPTFGRVSRHGAMALSWSMDKIGPMCRSVEDCAIVFHAIQGPDRLDPTVVDLPFNWSSNTDARDLRVGYVKEAFENRGADTGHRQRTLDTLRDSGIDLIPIRLPEFPERALMFIVDVEAAAAFDELTRSNEDDLLARQQPSAWPATFRQARFVPAVEYIQANRARTLLMREFDKAIAGVDAFVMPTFHNLLAINLTGHPLAVVPNGFSEQGMPTSIAFAGRLYREDHVLAVAKHFQDATDYHLQHPPLEV